MKVMHERRLDGVSVASNSQEREAPTHVLQTLSLVMDAKVSMDMKIIK